MSPGEKRAVALRTANAVRLARVELKRQLRDGTVTLDDILGGPHPAVVNTALLDVVMWTRRRGLQAPGLARIGEQAMRDGVNLLLPVGSASVRQRAWCASEGQRGTRVRARKDNAA